MNERLICLFCLVIGYFFGCFQTAYVVSRVKHVDIRKKGSGNLGTTNVFRTLGIRAGILTFVGDIMKVFVAMALVYFVFIFWRCYDIDRIALFMYTGIGVVFGHDFPFYLNFKGGKGVAATAAVLISAWDWRTIVAGVVIFFGIALATQYISVASLCLIGSEFVIFSVFILTGLMPVDIRWRPDVIILIALMTILVFWQHRKNIVRLKCGKENKFVFKSSKELREEAEMDSAEKAVQDAEKAASDK